MTSGLPEKKPGRAVVATAATAIGTAAIGAVVLQVMAFRIVGDIISSGVIFGLGYGLCWLRQRAKG